MRSLVLAFVMLVTAAAAAALQAQTPASSLDYDRFKATIQPIFLAKIDGFARCYTCHSQGTPFRLQRLSEGATAWNDEQSRQNFQAVQRLVKPGNPLTSRLLLMPLSHGEGGTEFHPGGKRWTSTANPEWKAIADWITAK
jgi:hypothetical protein